MNNVRKYRKEKGWSSEKLARKCDMAASTIYNLERDRRKPRVSTMRIIQEALGVPFAEIFPDAVQETGEHEEQSEKQNAFAKNLKARRVAALLPQDELEDRVDGKPGTGRVSRLETGEMIPKISLVRKLARVLGCSMADLLEGYEEEGAEDGTEAQEK